VLSIVCYRRVLFEPSQWKIRTSDRLYKNLKQRIHTDNNLFSLQNAEALSHGAKGR
jgi:hypothetical protein